MSELDPRHAAKRAIEAMNFLHAFSGQQFQDWHATNFDRRHLGAALDWLEELGGMVLTLADDRHALIEAAKAVRDNADECETEDGAGYTVLHDVMCELDAALDLFEQANA